MIREPLATVRPTTPSVRRKGHRNWRGRLRDAYRGVKLGVRGNSSFAVHFFCAAVVLAACVALQCQLWEWCVILLCIGVVFTAELFNSAIETLCCALDGETSRRPKGSLDIAAGAVLTASTFAALIGAIVLGNRLGVLMRWWE